MNVLSYTIGEMYRLADQYRSDVERLHLRTPEQIFYYVQNVPYVADHKECNTPECLKRPCITMERGGDCDDKTILAGAAFNLAGINWKIATASYNDPDSHTHVYAIIERNGRWLPFDATYPRNVLFSEQPYIDRKIWNMPTKSFHGVTTLEGSESIQIPNLAQWQMFINAGIKNATGLDVNVANNLTTALKSQLIGSISKIAAASVAIPGIGVLVGGLIAFFAGMVRIKGKTQHISYDDAFAKANDLARQINTLFASLPDDGKTFMYERAQIFLKEILAAEGAAWGNAMNNAVNAGKQRGYYNTPAGFVDASVVQTATIWMQSADLDGLADNFQKIYYEHYLYRLLLKPVQDYVETRARQLIEKEQAAKAAAANVVSNPIFWGVAALAAGMIFGLFKKGKK